MTNTTPPIKQGSDKLLSEQELREYVNNTLSPRCDKKDVEFVVTLIQSQKQAWGEYVIGENNPEDMEVPFSRIIQSDSTVGITQIDRQKTYNELRAEQRKTNKVHGGKKHE
jgi:hypothetical protein